MLINKKNSMNMYECFIVYEFKWCLVYATSVAVEEWNECSTDGMNVMRV